MASGVLARCDWPSVEYAHAPEPRRSATEVMGMSTEWENWEPLHGEQPYTLLALHPSGRFASRQVVTWTSTTVERAAIWETETRKLVWDPGNANAICWTPDGAELLLIRDPYDSAVIASGQGDYEHYFERRSWPSLEMIECNKYEIPDGWAVGLVAHPRRKLACVVWRDQCCSGVDFVSWEEGVARSLSDVAYSIGTNLNSDVAFSPDGRYLACAYGEECWWSEDSEEPSPGGEFRAGMVVVTDLNTWEHRDSEIVLSAPAGWEPEDPEDSEFLSRFSTPRFIDAEQFEVQSDLSGVLRFRVTGEKVAELGPPTNGTS